MTAPVRTKWRLEPATLCDLIEVCAQMRPDERDQYVALSGAVLYDFERAAASLYATGGVRFLLVSGAGERLAVGGFEDIRPGVWRSWLVATPAAWGRHWRSLTEASRFVADCLFEDGAHRIEDVMLADRERAGWWCQRGLGMQLDGILPNYAADGRDVAVYSRTRKQIELEAAHGHK